MNLSIIFGLLLTLVPGIELRLGLPLVIQDVLRNGGSVWFYFCLVLLLNILIIPLVFFFLDFFHCHLIKWDFYLRTFGSFVERRRKTAEKVQKRMHNLGYLALALFVAVPLVGTGAYTGTLIAWLLGLSKKKSFIAIALGVLGAGLIVFFLTLSAMGFFGYFI
jgi:uncharacterized membrane protein